MACSRCGPAAAACKMASWRRGRGQDRARMRAFVLTRSHEGAACLVAPSGKSLSLELGSIAGLEDREFGLTCADGRGVGGLASEVTHMNKQFLVRSPLDGCWPANKVGAQAGQDKNLTVPPGSGLHAAIYAPSMRTSRAQRSGGRGESVHFCSTGMGERLAYRPMFRPAHQDLVWQIGQQGWRISNVNGPHCTANGGEILRIDNFLVSKKLGPGTIRGITEIVGQLTCSIPSAGGLG